MAKSLAGKVALVTGGSRGIGAAIATRLAQDGAAVALTYTKGKEPADGVVRDRRDGRLPREPRGGVRHGREPHDRRRHERVTAG